MRGSGRPQHEHRHAFNSSEHFKNDLDQRSAGHFGNENGGMKASYKKHSHPREDSRTPIYAL